MDEGAEQDLMHPGERWSVPAFVGTDGVLAPCHLFLLYRRIRGVHMHGHCAGIRWVVRSTCHVMYGEGA
jgi:hypothetical protein